jgi:hypothetical protein
MGLRADFGRAARVFGGRYLPGFVRVVGGGCGLLDGERGRGLNFRIRLNKMPARPKLPVITRPRADFGAAPLVFTGGTNRRASCGEREKDPSGFRRQTRSWAC